MIPKLSLAAAAGMVFYAATLGLPTAGPCDGVAGAAPSPTCGGDLRECLRLSAKTGIYGARYVTAEDVATCMEAFNSCIHGGARTGGNPASPTTSSPGSRSTALPQHFQMNYKAVVSDCRVSGDTVTCASTLKPLPAGVASWEAKITGSVSGLTATGTKTEHVIGTGDCSTDSKGSGVFTYSFSSNGTVVIHEGPFQWQTTSCAGTNSSSEPARESAGTWSALE